ncbi:SDR family NAD(P)-dependent oxidoreductase [Aeromicrobium camelliae]|uniref:SDR family NAD(P)-dependent oxidoreductase n=1 Tax=Aeromicrobium camelliae TaxID=1538144 RepID=A0A3N6WQ03_9ACTN|nr:SDR family NAD(P)-dependent oxidoreductase [Aeromicrobium camelliae]RQN09596.1 SDR family NAD(P)-dependent oxidoreductase [Aeromicrobium camelliae]
MSTQPLAVVTGASSGIGAATARALAAQGYRVVCAARRTERITALASEIGGSAVTCDVTDTEAVAALADAVGPSLDLLVNNAGGAIGLERVDEADPEDWRRMYDINVIGTLNVTRALLPALRRAASGTGTIVNVGSIAGHHAYEGGGGYTAAKHGLAVMTETLRLELNGEPVRISEVAPGMVQTEEFSLTRFRGDRDRADQVYEGVENPLSADDVADAIAWIASRPAHVDIDFLVIKPVAQAASHKVARGPLAPRS